MDSSVQYARLTCEIQNVRFSFARGDNIIVVSYILARFFFVVDIGGFSCCAQRCPWKM